jgi:hypothetical protein
MVATLVDGGERELMIRSLMIDREFAFSGRLVG